MSSILKLVVLACFVQPVFLMDANGEAVIVNDVVTFRFDEGTDQKKFRDVGTDEQTDVRDGYQGKITKIDSGGQFQITVIPPALNPMQQTNRKEFVVSVKSTDFVKGNDAGSIASTASTAQASSMGGSSDSSAWSFDSSITGSSTPSVEQAPNVQYRRPPARRRSHHANTQDDWKNLQKAWRRDNQVEVNRILAKDGFDVNEPMEKDGQTMLYHYSRKGDTRIVERLRQCPNINPNKTETKYSCTPLHGAAEKNNVEIMTILRQYDRIDLNARNMHGDTPLSFACSKEKPSIVENLLEDSRTDLSIANSRGRTALYIAADKGNDEIVRRLIEVHDPDNSRRDTNINLKNSDEKTVLYAASHKGHVEVVRWLLEHPGVDVNVPHKHRDTPLYAACRNGGTEDKEQDFLDVVKLLLKHPNIQVNDSDELGVTPLFKACQKGAHRIVEALLRHDDVDVNKSTTDPNQFGVTPIFMACQEEKDEVVELLVRHENINVNTPRNDGATPLFISCQYGNVTIVKYLLSHPTIDLAPPKHIVKVDAEFPGDDLGIVFKDTDDGTSTMIKKVRDDSYAGIFTDLANYRGSTIVKVNDIKVSNHDDFLQAQASLTPGQPVEFTIELVQLHTFQNTRMNAFYIAKKNKHQEVVDLLKAHKAKKEHERQAAAIKIQSVIRKKLAQSAVAKIKQKEQEDLEDVTNAQKAQFEDPMDTSSDIVENSQTLPEPGNTDIGSSDVVENLTSQLSEVQARETAAKEKNSQLLTEFHQAQKLVDLFFFEISQASVAVKNLQENPDVVEKMSRLQELQEQNTRMRAALENAPPSRN